SSPRPHRNAGGCPPAGVEGAPHRRAEGMEGADQRGAQETIPPIGRMSDAPRFRGSAAVVLVHGHGTELQTFWVRRSDAVPFMPAFHAFIGGSVEPGDALLPLEGGGDGGERALKACAIREAFEEAGVLVGLRGPAPDAAVLDDSRRALLAGEVAFNALAA